MKIYFVGWHQPNKGLSGTYLFSRRKIPVFISVRRLWKRRSKFPAHKWVMDSGAFKELELNGKYTFTLMDYAREIIRWWTPTLLAVVTPDFMCEDYIFAQREKHTGIRYTIAEHQRLTVYNYKALRRLLPAHIYLMPVLQGFTPDEYVDCMRLYGDALKPGMWVGVGSVCKRQGSPKHIEEVLKAIKRERPDLKLHGFGVKKTSLIESATVVDLLHSADSQAHNFVGSRKPGDRKFHSGNDPKNAIAYYYSVVNNLPKVLQLSLF